MCETLPFCVLVALRGIGSIGSNGQGEGSRVEFSVLDAGRAYDMGPKGILWYFENSGKTPIFKFYGCLNGHAAIGGKIGVLKRFFRIGRDGKLFASRGPNNISISGQDQLDKDLAAGG